MSLRDTEPDFIELLGITPGDDDVFEASLQAFHGQRYDRGQYHEPGTRFDPDNSPTLTPQAAPRTRTVVVDINDELPYPDRAKVVAAAKKAGDRYRAISRRYAGLS